jgi:periplasmic mercuric ion binding protein
MKTIKMLFVMAFAISMTSASNAQQFNYKLDGPFAATKTIKVSGVCPMCQHRIENAVKNLPGIWSSYWDINSQMLWVTYDRLRLSPDRIEQQIAAAGHDTGKFRAQDQVYVNLPDCCHYPRKS